MSTTFFTVGSSVTAASSATFTALTTQQFSLAAHAFASNSISLVRYTAQGALDDWGFWDAGQPDAARTRVVAHLGNVLDSSAQRAWITTTKPEDYNGFWHNAAFATVGFKYPSMPNNGVHYVDKFQFEPVTQADNLLPYEAASLEGSITPFTAINTGNCSVTRTTSRAYSGSHSLQMVTTTGGTIAYYRTVGQAAMSRVPAVAAAQVSASVRVSTDLPSRQFRATIRFYGADLSFIAATSPGYSTHPGDGTWMYLITSGTVPAGAAWYTVNAEQGTSGQVTGDNWFADEHFLYANGYSYGPTPYTDPRKISIQIKGERINYARNTLSTNTGTQGYQVFGAATTAISQDLTVGLGGTYSMKVVVTYYNGTPSVPPWYGTSSTTSYNGPSQGNISGLRPGRQYVASTWVKQAPNCPPVYCEAIGYAVGTSTAQIMADPNKASDPNFVQPGGWVRVYTTFEINAGDTGEVSFGAFIQDADQVSGQNSQWWMTQVLVEEGTLPGDWFDGSLAGDDYVWEGTPYWSRSHYYQGKREKSYRLTQLVTDNLPLGATFQILYAPSMEQYESIAVYNRGPATPISVAGGSRIPFSTLSVPAAPIIQRYY